MKYILLTMAALLIGQHSEAWGIKLPTPKDIVKGAERVAKGVEKAAKGVGKAVEGTGKAVGGAVEDVAKGAGNVVGAVVEGAADVAEGALKEGANVVGNIGQEMQRGTERIVTETKRIGRQAEKDFKNGLPYYARLSACMATLCYSEYKLNQEIEEAKKEFRRKEAQLKAEVDAAVESKRVEKIKEFISLLESRKAELVTQNSDFEKVQRLNTNLGVELTKRLYRVKILQTAGKQIELADSIQNELFQELVAELNSGVYFNRSQEEVDLIRELVVVAGELELEVTAVIAQLPLHLNADVLYVLSEKIMNQKSGFTSLESDNALELADIEEKLAMYKAEIGV